MRIGVFLTGLTCLGMPFMVNAGCKPSITTVKGGLKSGQQLCSGELIFNEEFDTFDESVWNHELQVDGAGNGEFQQNTNDRSISFAKDGNLYILPKIVGDVPLNDGYFNPIQSARMTTDGNFYFKYGKVDIRAKMPGGDWLWPALWMMPQDSVYGGWPLSGELDIIENRGNKDMKMGTTKIGAQQALFTIHWGTDKGGDQFDRTSWQQFNDDGFDEDYHVYSVEWTPDYFVYRLDDVEVGRLTIPDGGFYEYGEMTGENPWANGSKMAPFDQSFYLILQVSIGGTSGMFPDNVDNPGGKPWNNTTPAPQAARDFWNAEAQWRPTWNEGTTQRALKVDYVKVWSL